METKSTNTSALFYGISGVILLLTVWGLYPFLQNYIDPDATSYLTISKRYLQGDYQNAINAFWSPLGIWLTTLAVKTFGWELFTAAIIVNTIASLSTLWTSQYLFHKFRQSAFERLLFAVFFALFWAYATYKQSFTDIWQYFFLTLYFLILTHQAFVRKWHYWIGLGIVAALAYFAKAYAFYYSLLLLCIILGMQYKYYKNISFKKLILIFVVVLITQVLVASPWIGLLYQKYHQITLSTAGNLNLSWWLMGTQDYNSNIKVVLPPSVSGGIFCFEDPYLYQGNLPKFWHAPGLFFKQMIRVAYNYLGWNESANILSSFYFSIWIISLVYFFSKKRWQQNQGIQQVWLFFISYPIAFWLMTFDHGRYLWLTLPLSCILALYFFELWIFPVIHSLGRKILTAILFLSLIITPIADLKEMWRAGDAEKELAQSLNALGIQGGFISNLGYEKSESPFLLRLAYFAQCPWYCTVSDEWSTTAIIQDAARYKVPYYFYFYKGAADNFELKDANGNVFPEITKDKIKGIKVFALQ